MVQPLRKRLLIRKIIEEGKKDDETWEDFYDRILSIEISGQIKSPILLPRISSGYGYGYKPITLTSYNKGKKHKIFKFDYLDEFLADLNKDIDK